MCSFDRILVEADVYTGEDVSDTWFQKMATDLRYSSVEFLPLYPVTSLSNAKQIQFSVPGFTGAGAVKLHDSFLALKVKLCKADGTTKVDAGKVVAPVNLTLHSLFSSCQLYLNDTLLNTHNDLYNYKSLLLASLSYGADAKYSFLQGAAMYPDTAGQYNNPAFNTGFKSRSNKFKKSPTSQEYHGEEVQLASRLYLDLVTTDTPVPPGVSIRVVLTLAPHDFVIQVPDTDNDSYTMVITEAILHLPIASLSPEVYTRFERKLAEQDASIFFRRIEMSTKTIPKGTTVFNSEALFSSQANPCKLIAGLVSTKAFLGDFKKNPYFFQRLWTDGGTSYVVSMSLTLNAKSLDGLEGKATERDDMMRFLRMQYFLQADSNDCNNITYDDFLKGCFLGIWDTSTSGHCGYDFLAPATRMGSLRLNIEFSSPSKEEITVIMFSEFPSVCRINKARQISLSYF